MHFLGVRTVCSDPLLGGKSTLLGKRKLSALCGGRRFYDRVFRFVPQVVEALEKSNIFAVFAEMQIRQFFLKIDYQNDRVCGTMYLG